MGTQQMHSVPYALYAQTAGSSAGTGWADSAGHLYNTNTGNVGIGTSTPAARLHVLGTTALGEGSVASGANSTAMAGGNAEGENSVAIGGVSYLEGISHATGYNAVAITCGTANGNMSFAANVGTTGPDARSATAIGYGIANGVVSVAIGSSGWYGSTTNGDFSTALGGGSASGTWAVAIGTDAVGLNRSQAVGVASTAIGGGYATGENATAIGRSYNEMGGSQSTAAGSGSFAAGGGQAVGIGSLAFGSYTSANGAYSVAMYGTADASNSFAASDGFAGAGASFASAISGGRALGTYAVAMGANLWGRSGAAGAYATAIGGGNASGNSAVAIGAWESWPSSATGSYATALGGGNASGPNSIALGGMCDAAGERSIAFTGGSASGLGSFASGGVASGYTAYAIGWGTHATGDRSFAIGQNVSTNNKSGSFAIGCPIDYSAENDANNQMMMNFSGGYKLYTNNLSTSGLELTPAGPARYMTDVTAAFDDRSLVDKHYVDSVAAGGSAGSNWATAGADVYNTNPGRIGIGINTPKARLHVADSSVVFTGPALISSGPYADPPISGSGSRMMWYADKAAFRVGSILADEWDRDNVGINSFASGNLCVASGHISAAMGYDATASGDFSTALGAYVSTNNKYGAFIMGDAYNSDNRNNDADNQMMMHFAGGYKLYTDAYSTVGTQIAPGGNSWATISDRRKKENFSPVNGEAFLKKIARMALTSWNYKGQDPKLYRHYGPMAQDFYAAFGNDGVGTIGNDTTINQADMEGVSLVAIQALVKRTEELKKENEQLKQQLSQYQAENGTLKAEITRDRQETNARLREIELMLRKENTVAK
jgi:hypothetical protein